MKNRFLWEHLRSPELKELAEKDAIVIMPVGAIEQHGPHLPVNTDLITARWLSQLVAERLDAQGLPVIIAPEFVIANSLHHMHFAGSLAIEPLTFIQVLKEQCRAIASHGFRKIAMINGHGGNTMPINVALIDINRELGVPVYHVNCLANVDESQFLDRQQGMIHAGEVETSIVLAYDESLVDPCYKEQFGNPAECTRYEDDGILSTFHYMEASTPNGIMALTPVLVSKHFGAKYCAQNYGLIACLGFINGFIGSQLEGVLADRFGSFQYGYLVCAVYLAIAVVLAWKLPKK